MLFSDSGVKETTKLLRILVHARYDTNMPEGPVFYHEQTSEEKSWHEKAYEKTSSLSN